jgi:hypothetical protein
MSDARLKELNLAMERLCPGCGLRLLTPAEKPKDNRPVPLKCPDQKVCKSKLMPLADGRTYELRGAKTPVGIELAGQRHTLAGWADLRWSLHEEVELPPVDAEGRKAPLGWARVLEVFSLKSDHYCQMFVGPTDLFFIRLGGTLSLMLHVDPYSESAATGNTLVDLLGLALGDRSRGEMDKNLQLLAERSLEEMLAVHAFNFRQPLADIVSVELVSTGSAAHGYPEVGQMRLQTQSGKRTFRFPFHRDLLMSSYLLVDQLGDRAKLQYACDLASGKLVKRKDRNGSI